MFLALITIHLSLFREWQKSVYQFWGNATGVPHVSSVVINFDEYKKSKEAGVR